MFCGEVFTCGQSTIFRALSVLEKRKAKEIELINKTKTEELKRIKDQRLESVLIIIGQIQKAINDKDLSLAKKIVAKATKEDPDFTHGDTINAILNLDISYKLSSYTESSGHSYIQDGNSRYTEFKILYKHAEVLIKNTSKTELTDCKFTLTNLHLQYNQQSAKTLKPGGQLMVRSESVMASKDKTDLIYGVSVSFPLQDPLSDVIQYLKLPFENPIEIRDTRFGFVAYFESPLIY